MKLTKLFPVLLVTISLFSVSCEKEKVDEREKFVGTWYGSQVISVPSLNYVNTGNGTNIISKSSVNDNQIVITTPGGSMTLKANVKGKTYEYEKYSETENVEGVTITMEYTGTGSIDGNKISENGSIVFFTGGQSYVGTWSTSLNKQ